VAHAELVAEHVLVAREDHYLGRGRFACKDARIQHELDVAIVDSGVVGAAVRLNVLGVRRIRPHVDEVLLLVRAVARNVRVVLVRLHQSKIRARARLDALGVVELDGNVADRVQRQTGRRVDGAGKIKRLVLVLLGLRRYDHHVLHDDVVELQTHVGAHAGGLLRGPRGGVRNGLLRLELELVDNLLENALLELFALVILLL
jgi:hypothetical protein